MEEEGLRERWRGEEEGEKEGEGSMRRDGGIGEEGRGKGR